MARIAPYVFFQELDNNGNPLAGGKVNTFESGTVVLKQTFTTEDESTPNANPVILDANGRADIWLESGSYTFRIDDANDVPISTVDDITGEASNVFGADVIDVSTNTTVTLSNQNNVINATAALTLSLVSAVTAEEGFVFTVRNSSSGQVIIDPDGSETIDGTATKTIEPDGSMIIDSTGTNWITFSENYGTVNPRNTTWSGNNTHSGNNTFTGTNSFSAVTTHTATVVWDKGADVASAGTLVLGTGGNYFNVTGTMTITDITVPAGTLFMLEFDDILILTHNGTTLTLPSGANITTAAGDTLIGFATATDTVKVLPYTRADGTPLVSGPTLETPQTTTSGTEKDFTSLRSGITKIMVMFDGVSTSGTSPLTIQLGDSGGFETTGYTGVSERVGTSRALTATGFNVGTVAAATDDADGQVELNLLDSSTNTWTIGGEVAENTTTTYLKIFGVKSLSSELTQVRITTAGGSDTFDTGKVNIITE